MTDSVRESAQAPQATQAPRRNVAAKTSLATDLSLIAVFAGFIAALAIMPAVSLGGVAVPFTFQTLGIYITAQVLGGKRATASVALYLLVGFAGLPIFAKGGAGLGTLASPRLPARLPALRRYCRYPRLPVHPQHPFDWCDLPYGSGRELLRFCGSDHLRYRRYDGERPHDF